MRPSVIEPLYMIQATNKSGETTWEPVYEKNLNSSHFFDEFFLSEVRIDGSPVFVFKNKDSSIVWRPDQLREAAFVTLSGGRVDAKADIRVMPKSEVSSETFYVAKIKGEWVQVFTQSSWNKLSHEGSKENESFLDQSKTWERADTTLHRGCWQMEMCCFGGAISLAPNFDPNGKFKSENVIPFKKKHKRVSNCKPPVKPTVRKAKAIGGVSEKLLRHIFAALWIYIEEANAVQKNSSADINTKVKEEFRSVLLAMGISMNDEIRNWERQYLVNNPESFFNLREKKEVAMSGLEPLTSAL